MADSMTPDILKIAEAFASKESSTAEDVIALVRGLKQIEDSSSAPLFSSTAIPAAAATEQPIRDQDQRPAPLPLKAAAASQATPSAPKNREVATAEPEKDPVEAASASSSTTTPKTRKKADRLKPAVPYEKAVTDNLVYCLECGRGMKMMKRHLNETHGMTPEDYRKRWQLPDDWPITAPNYAASKSQYAKNMGLGVPGKAAPAHSNKGRKPKGEPTPVEVNEEG